MGNFSFQPPQPQPPPPPLPPPDPPDYGGDYEESGDTDSGEQQDDGDLVENEGGSFFAQPALSLQEDDQDDDGGSFFAEPIDPSRDSNDEDAGDGSFFAGIAASSTADVNGNADGGSFFTPAVDPSLSAGGSGANADDDDQSFFADLGAPLVAEGTEAAGGFFDGSQETDTSDSDAGTDNGSEGVDDEAALREDAGSDADGVGDGSDLAEAFASLGEEAADSAAGEDESPAEDGNTGRDAEQMRSEGSLLSRVSATTAQASSDEAPDSEDGGATRGPALGVYRRALPDGTTREDVPDAIRLYNPDGSSEERTADGVNTFTTRGGSSMTVRSDGAVSASPDISLRPTADGNIEGTTPSGDVITATSDGGLSVKSPDGTVRGIGGDGTTFVQADGWSIVTSPNGADSTATANFPGGVIISLQSSGTLTVGTPDGQVSFRGDGTVAIDRQDGVTIVRSPDGEKDVTTPDGVTFVSSADGEVVRVEYPDGTVLTPDDGNVLDDVIEGAAEILEGAWEEAERMAKSAETLAPLALTLLPNGLGQIADPDGVRRAQATAALGRALVQAAEHPGAFAKALVDWDTWKENPLRAVGHLLPVLAITIVTGGSGAIAEAEDVGGAAALRLGEEAVAGEQLAGEIAKVEKLGGEGSAVAEGSGETADVATKIDDAPAATKADDAAGSSQQQSIAAPDALGDPAQAWTLDPRARGREIQGNLAATDYQDYIETDQLAGFEKSKNFPLIDWISGDGSRSVSLKTYDPSTKVFDSGETMYSVQHHAQELVDHAPGTRVTLDIRVPPDWPESLRSDLRDGLLAGVDDPEGRLDVEIKEFP
jgi:hypothetical protein